MNELNETAQNIAANGWWWRFPLCFGILFGFFYLCFTIPTPEEEEKREKQRKQEELDKKILSERWKNTPGFKWFD